MGTIKKITAVKRRALCPKCFSVIQWDNATFERYDSETNSYYIICPAELNESNCGQRININKIDPNTYLDSDIIFEPVEGGETISIDSEDVNFNSSDTTLRASNVKEAINELDNNINNLNANNINYDNTQSELESENIQNAIDELKENINTIDKKEIQAKDIIYDNAQLESKNVQNVIDELDEKINRINLENNSITVILSEVKNTNDGIFFIFSGLDFLVNMLNNVSTETTSLINYTILLHVTHPTFVNKSICLITYQSDSSNEEQMHIFVNNNEIITVTNDNITWKTADSQTVSIPVNAINSDGSYIYNASQ